MFWQEEGLPTVLLLNIKKEGPAFALPCLFSLDKFADISDTKGGYMNSFTEFLDLEDSDLFISDIHVEGTRKFITRETTCV